MNMTRMMKLRWKTTILQASISASYPIRTGSPSMAWEWRWISIRCITHIRRLRTGNGSSSPLRASLIWTGMQASLIRSRKGICVISSSRSTDLYGVVTGRTGRITSILRYPKVSLRNCIDVMIIPSALTGRKPLRSMSKREQYRTG